MVVVMVEAISVGLTLVAVVVGVVIGRWLGSGNGEVSEQTLRLVLQEENQKTNKDLRGELREMNTSTTSNLLNAVGKVGETQQENLKQFGERITEMGSKTEAGIKEMQNSNEKKLDQMRETVDEKLQTTLEKRLGESFKLVSERLEAVQKGLGEMVTLATDVSGLKKVLSNVSARGAMGELQAEQILSDIMAPSQYQKNVKTHPDCEGQVEFAIRLPGSDANMEEPVWLPIDCKFPIEDHQRWISALDAGDKSVIEKQRNALVANVKAEAKKINKKYVRTPYTTDFAVMFLPTEGLYADIARQPGLIESLQRDHHIMIAGPSNFAALLNSLQMGFRTLALESQASEVWKVLGAVKTEFSKFGAHLGKLHKQLNTAANTIGGDGESLERRMRAMERALRNVESLSGPESSKLLDFKDDIDELE